MTLVRPCRGLLVFTLILFLTVGCAVDRFPRDPEGTLERVSGGVLRVGVSENPPWTRVADDGTVTGTEADIVTGYAQMIGARIAWTSGAESQLIEQLDRGQLDLVIGGLRSDLPWQSHAAYTRPYASQAGPDGSTRELVFATRLGENGFLNSLERYLIARGLQP